MSNPHPNTSLGSLKYHLSIFAVTPLVLIPQNVSGFKRKALWFCRKHRRPLGILNVQTWNTATHIHVALFFICWRMWRGRKDNTLKLPYMPQQTKLTSSTIHWRAVKGWGNLRWGWECFCLNTAPNSNDRELPQAERKCYTVHSWQSFGSSGATRATSVEDLPFSHSCFQLVWQQIPPTYHMPKPKAITEACSISVKHI